MVICTISGKCHHEVDTHCTILVSNIGVQHSFRLGSLGQNIELEGHTFWFDPHTLIFRQNMSDGYMFRQRPM